MPILVIKDGEVKALREISVDEANKVVPLMQITRKYKTEQLPNGHRKQVPYSETESLGKRLNQLGGLLRFEKLFVDSRPLMQSNTNETIQKIGNLSGGQLFKSCVVIPVLTIEDLKTQNYDSNSITYFKEHGICLRIFKEDINDFWLTIDSLLNKVDLKRKDVDLVIDYKKSNQEEVKELIQQTNKIKEANGWRSIFFANGSFPTNLSEFTNIGKNTKSRSDWDSWLLVRKGINQGLDIGYGDYAIRNPQYMEPAENATPSRSFIYARENEWVVMKGQTDDRNGEKAKQYRALSQILIKGKLVNAKHSCPMEKHITNLDKNKGADLGGFTTWIKLGIGHHISLTLHQISNLN